MKGRADEIYIRASSLAADMILTIIKRKIGPKPQKGKITIFKRRIPKESEIPECKNIEQLFDFIRMLDTEGYPRAFIKNKGFVFEFSRPALYPYGISADVKIKKEKKDKK